MTCRTGRRAAKKGMHMYNMHVEQVGVHCLADVCGVWSGGGVGGGGGVVSTLIGSPHTLMIIFSRCRLQS